MKRTTRKTQLRTKSYAHGSKVVRTTQRGVKAARDTVALGIVAVAGFVTGAWDQLMR